MMFTKVGLRLASAALPGVRAGVGVPERRLCSRALPVSAAARLVRVEPLHWAGMVVAGIVLTFGGEGCPARANLLRADPSEQGHLAFDITLPGAEAGVFFGRRVQRPV
jgi:hypothetical protein